MSKTRDNECPTDCGDSSCACASTRSGMRTNGGCQCIKHIPSRYRIGVTLALSYWRKRALEAEAELDPTP